MTRVRRTDYLLFHLQNRYQPDFAALLTAGEIRASVVPQILAISLLTGQRYHMHPGLLECLLSIPSDRWVEGADVADDDLELLAARGLVVTDDPSAELSQIRRRDDALTANQWNLYAALYHFMTKWSESDPRVTGDPELASSLESEALAREFLSTHGPPPPPFHERSFGPTQPLPPPSQDGELFRTLARRKTTRGFDSTRPMSVEDLSTVLHQVFGCHGYARTLSGVVCIKRTSPSGGGLHPIEAYPVVANVSGVQPGIYHYNVRDHSLELLEEMDALAVRQTATAFMCGQSYFGAAHVCFVLTARFYRNHWKYRQHEKAYAALLMDAAHLSQTLYLVGADLGLGAFVTIAINSCDIEDRLDLDGYSEGVVAMTGCGPRTAGKTPPLELRFRPDLRSV